MPAIMDDPTAPTIYRVSGEAPYPDPSHPSLPASIVPRQVTLRDRQTVATIVPFISRDQVPPSLLLYLSDQFAKEIEKGDTYPMIDPMSHDKFSAYWFQNFGAIMLLGNIESPEEVVEGKDWSKECLGSFYIKPNYPGRSSHICNAGFLVTDASRNRGVGRLMGESYIEWAPKLGYIYSVFNLVYETNVASCKIWDALGFKRIGRVKGCGNLKSYPGRLIDAIIYGRDLVVGDSEELVSEERFDKIKFYLKFGKYPNGADRAEKSRLRSAATHYKLLENDKLMLKDKEVISDPQRQYDIARMVHVQSHGGINKTTATIADKYHWSRIKETVSDVIRACGECKDVGKAQVVYGSTATQQKKTSISTSVTPLPPLSAQQPLPSAPSPSPPAVTPGGIISPDRREFVHHDHHHHLPPFSAVANPYAHSHDLSVNYPAQTLHTPTDSPIPQHTSLPGHSSILQNQSHHQLHPTSHHPGPLPLSISHGLTVYGPIDPQIITQASSYSHHHPVHHDTYTPFNAHNETDSFQALLNAAADDLDDDAHHHHHHDEADQAALSRDLEMLIDPPDDEDDVSTVMDMDISADVGLGHHDLVDHDDLSKMSVGHLLASPQPSRVGLGRKDDSSDVTAAAGKAKGIFDDEYSAQG